MIVRKGAARRRATAAVEAAILLPTLVLLALITFDYCRVFQYAEVLANCARAGAVYSVDPYGQQFQTPAFSSWQDAAKAEWPYDPNLLTLTKTPSTGADGHNYVDVQAQYTFNTVVSYLGIPATVNLSRTVRARVMQPYPTGINGP
jgi:Flp pilus assembly protein TadG